MNPKRLVALACGLNLTAGVLVGVLADRYLLAPRADAVESAPADASEGKAGGDDDDHRRHRGRRGRGGRDGRDGGPLSWMVRELELTEEQSAAVKKVFEDSRPRFKEAFAKVKPELDAIREEADGQVRALLTEEQATKLDELKKKFEEARAARRAEREKRKQQSPEAGDGDGEGEGSAADPKRNGRVPKEASQQGRVPKEASQKNEDGAGPADGGETRDEGS